VALTAEVKEVNENGNTVWWRVATVVAGLASGAVGSFGERHLNREEGARLVQSSIDLAALAATVKAQGEMGLERERRLTEVERELRVMRVAKVRPPQLGR
jgi:hypothetical protein